MTESTRRQFLEQSSCAAWVMGLAAISPAGVRAAFSQTDKRKVVSKEKWGRIEQVADRIWALVSTPFETRDYTTVSNGGIIAGTDRVVVIEGLNQPKGAKWLAERAKELTGKWPTDVVVTHYHSDHSAGVMGYQLDGTDTHLWLTKQTQTLIETKNKRGGKTPKLLPSIKTVAADKPVTIDLGGRTVLIQTQSGHTPSDVTIEVKEPNVLFCGDLFFNRLVPNYVDAQPRKLKASVAGFKREKDTLYIPGHGSIATAKDLSIYCEFLDMMEDSAAKSLKAGKSAKAAAAEFKLPTEFAKWYIFSPQVIPRAFAAWYRELER
jgi:glyoxylase-like metal-dependent hydrolase (beta-lactamase superfamily II)